METVEKPCGRSTGASGGGGVGGADGETRKGEEVWVTKALQVMAGTVLAQVGHGNGGTYLSGLW